MALPYAIYFDSREAAINSRLNTIPADFARMCTWHNVTEEGVGALPPDASLPALLDHQNNKCIVGDNMFSYIAALSSRGRFQPPPVQTRQQSTQEYRDRQGMGKRAKTAAMEGMPTIENPFKSMMYSGTDYKVTPEMREQYLQFRRQTNPTDQRVYAKAPQMGRGEGDLLAALEAINEPMQVSYGSIPAEAEAVLARLKEPEDDTSVVDAAKAAAMNAYLQSMQNMQQAGRSGF